MKAALFLYRGLNGTNPSAFRIDEDGVSFFEERLSGYKFNLSILVSFEGNKVPGVIAVVNDPMLNGGIAEFTPQFGDGHWSLRFPDLNVEEIKILLSRFAKFVLK